MTAPKLLLHVGAPKTGTSYLERIIWPQREQLLRDGIWMPGTSRLDHDALMGEVRGSIWRDPDSEWTWGRVVAEATRRDETVLVSKEMLAGAPQPQVDKLMAKLTGFEVHIIVTCRALAATIPSAWQQNVKANQKHTFEEFLEEIHSGARPSFWRSHDPFRIARRWGAGLPADQIHVVTMSPRKDDPTLLWRRFASVLGVDPGAYRTPERLPNESLGAVEAEFLRRVNIELDDQFPMRTPWLDDVHAPLIRDVLLDSDIVPPGGRRRFGVPAKHRDWVLEWSREQIDQLAAFPCTIVGDLDDLEPRLDPNAPSPDDITDEELAAFGAKVVAQLLRNRAAERSTGASAPPGG